MNSTVTIPENVTEARKESLTIAVELGADQVLLDRLAAATRLSRATTIVLPVGRYDHCSRSKGWCRNGRGDSASWGEKTAKGWRVGAGTWLVCSSDGFRREERLEWKVRNITVGEQIWTIAD
jgi:hypothetical protein